MILETRNQLQRMKSGKFLPINMHGIQDSFDTFIGLFAVMDEVL